MKLRGEHLYNQMQHDLGHCRTKEFSIQVESECCFRISEKYWQLLREELKRVNFISPAQEIIFFKEIKPRFVAESEYHRLVNYAANFCPDDEFPADQKNFWTRQLDRLEKFKQRHQAFWAYYSSGQNSHDHIYFTRQGGNNENYLFDKTTSGFDELMGQLIARERYAEYAKEKLSAVVRFNDK